MLTAKLFSSKSMVMGIFKSEKIVSIIGFSDHYAQNFLFTGK